MSVSIMHTSSIDLSREIVSVKKGITPSPDLDEQPVPRPKPSLFAENFRMVGNESRAMSKDAIEVPSTLVIHDRKQSDVKARSYSMPTKTEGG